MHSSYRRRFNFRVFIMFEFATLLAGTVGALLGGIGNFQSFGGLVAPPLTPPPLAFPMVWTVLYILMAASAYMVWNAHDIDGTRMVRLYMFQLAVNAAWPLIFFRLRLRLVGFFWIIALIAVVTLMMAGFKYVKKASYNLLIPYLLWLIYAAYLCLGFYLLNT